MGWPKKVSYFCNSLEIRLFKRFLSTAFRRNFLPKEKAARRGSSSFGCAKNLAEKNGVCQTPPFWNTTFISSFFFRRCFLANIGFLYRETLSSDSSAGFDNSFTRLGTHTLQKAVTTRSFACFWLIRSFHRVLYKYNQLYRTFLFSSRKYPPRP